MQSSWDIIGNAAKNNMSIKRNIATLNYNDNIIHELIKLTNASKGLVAVHAPPLATVGSYVPQTVPHHKKPFTIVVYPTIAPEKIVIPIISCIFGFPLLALLIICCLKHRAKAARERERRRTANLGTDHSAISLVRFSPIHKLGVYLAGGTQPTVQINRNRSSSLRSERSMSRHFQSLELDTVIEERNSEPDSDSVIFSTTIDKPSLNEASNS